MLLIERENHFEGDLNPLSQLTSITEMKLDHNQLEGNLKPLSKITEMRELNLVNHFSWNGRIYFTMLERKFTYGESWSSIGFNIFDGVICGNSKNVCCMWVFCIELGNSVDKHAHHLHFIPKKSSDSKVEHNCSLCNFIKSMISKMVVQVNTIIITKMVFGQKMEKKRLH